MIEIVFRRLFISTFFIVLNISAFSQLMPYRQYTVKDGLPSSNIYSITQDSTGFIWLGTDNGLCRFDGYEFLKIDEVGEGIYGYISTIAFDVNENSIVIGTGFDGIFEYKINKNEIVKIIHEPPHLTQPNKLILKDSLILSLHRGNHFEISDRKGRYIMFDSISYYNNSSNAQCIFLDAHNEVFIGRTDGLYSLTENLNQSKLNSTKVPVYSIHNQFGDSALIGGVGNLFKKNNTSLTLNYQLPLKEDKIHDLLVDDLNNIWLTDGTIKNTYILLSDTIIALRSIIKLDNSGLSNLFKDKYGNIWVGVFGNGLYCFQKGIVEKHYPLNVNDTSSSFLNGIYSIDSNIVIGTFDGILSNNSINQFLHKKFNYFAIEYVRDIDYSDSAIFICVADIRVMPKSGDLFLNVGKMYNRTVYLVHASCLSIIEDDIYIGNWDNRVIVFNGSSNRIIDQFNVAKQPISKLRVNDIAKFDSAVYISTQAGLFQKIKNSISRVPIMKNMNENILKLEVSSSINKMIVHTSNSIYTYSHLLGFDRLEYKKEHISYAFNNIFTDFIIQTTGNRFTILHNNDSLSISYDHSMPNSILTAKDRVWFLSNNEISSLAFDDFYNYKYYHKTDISFINSYNVYSDSTNGRILFPPSHEKVFLKYTTFNYTNPEALTYKYRVDDSDWITTKKNEIELSSLGYGEHDIEIMASYYGGKFGPKSTIAVYMMPPFWHSYYFYLLCLLSLSAFIYHVIKSRQGILKYHSRGFLHNQLLIENLKTRTGTNNLNPHFIYNAINSIKDFLKKNSLNKSFAYIDQFSKLIRLNIAGSQEMGISIHDEISRLKHYLELEKLRLAIPFDYDFRIDEELSLKLTWIPNMVIHPFIENVTWYGFQEPLIRGKITVEFLRDEENIMIYITDNGIGVKEARIRQIEHHKSLGTSLVYSKLSSLDPFTDDIISVNNANDDPHLPGTRVTIKLTPRMYTELKTRKLSEK